MRDGTAGVWRELAHPAFLRTSLPWRAAGYLLASGTAGLLLCVGLLVAATAAGVLAVVLVGLPLLAALALVGLPFAAWERWLLRTTRLADTVPGGSHLVPGRPGLTAWLRLRYREQATWRELGFSVLAAFVLWPVDLVVAGCALAVPGYLIAALPLLLADGDQVNVLKLWQVHSPLVAGALTVAGFAALALAGYPLTLVAAGRAALARNVLAPAGQELRIGELVSSRARLVDAFEAERRRIERDLHDGAQQRLVALAMALGLARLDAEPGSALAERLADAHREAGHVLEELRELINGIHPQVLTDHGLPDACTDAADRSPVPVEVGFELPGRLPPAVESAGYFAVSEALANIAKHSGAGSARVDGRHAGGLLVIEVSDDGRGGADPALGSGLTGLADRVSVLDGTLLLSSPPGGPTLLRMEIPCTPIGAAA
ncbi:sensor domain-containing protein [Kitasatospora sp. NE20-6]|uniref:sensor histidine kinase n=1 Tax=Kitasatospora sp. NE20-6 TaxID=2859066 RepID=UPI0038B39F6C